MSSRIWRFGVVGVANTAIGLAVIYGALFAGLGDFASNALGYGSGLLVSFVLHRGWTFAGRTKSLQRDAVGFVLAWAAAYIANLTAIALGRGLGFFDNPFVQLAGVAVFSATFYLLTSRMVFASETAPKVAAQGSASGPPETRASTDPSRSDTVSR
jgi:putative flippase GtrA